MKRDKKKLSLDVETLRSLETTDLVTVQGGQGEQAFNLSIFCNLSKQGCNSFLGVCTKV
jgi:hypothetical protein